MRCSFGWDTPNEAGYFLACLAILMAGLSPRHKIFIIVASFATVALALTGSRGGILAAIVAGSMVAIIHVWRLGASARSAILCLLLIGIGLCGIGEVVGATRLSGIAYVSSDASIMSRLELWRHALIAIYDNPLTGVTDFGRYNAVWFPEISNMSYWPGAINDFLTIAANFGLPVLVVAMYLLFFPLVVGLFYSKSLIVNLVSPVLLCGLVASFFSDLAFNFSSSWIWWFCLLVLLVRSLAIVKSDCHLAWRVVVISSLFVAMVSGGIYGLGWIASTSYPIGVSLVNGQATAFPRGETGKGTVFVIPSESDMADEVNQYIIKAWALNGYVARLSETTTGISDITGSKGRPFILHARQMPFSKDMQRLMCSCDVAILEYDSSPSVDLLSFIDNGFPNGKQLVVISSLPEPVTHKADVRFLTRTLPIVTPRSFKRFAFDVFQIVSTKKYQSTNHNERRQYGVGL